jgi:hypothetical protein
MPCSTSGDNPFEGRVAVKIVSISDLVSLYERKAFIIIYFYF